MIYKLLVAIALIGIGNQARADNRFWSGGYTGSSGGGSTASLGTGGSAPHVRGETYKCRNAKTGSKADGYYYQTICGWS